METFDNLFRGVARFQPFARIRSIIPQRKGGNCDLPHKRNDPRWVAEPRLEESATHNLERAYERRKSGFVDIQRQSLHVQICRTTIMQPLHAVFERVRTDFGRSRPRKRRKRDSTIGVWRRDRSIDRARYLVDTLKATCQHAEMCERRDVQTLEKEGWRCLILRRVSIHLSAPSTLPNLGICVSC